MKTAVQVTMYLNESDKWDQILQMLRRENVAGASVLHAAAGFNGRHHIHTASLVEGGGDLPVVLIFVDLEEHVSRVLPKLFQLAPNKLVVRENVVIEQGNLE
jgi:PII-like signaling protein